MTFQADMHFIQQTNSVNIAGRLSMCLRVLIPMILFIIFLSKVSNSRIIKSHHMVSNGEQMFYFFNFHKLSISIFRSIFIWQPGDSEHQTARLSCDGLLGSVLWGCPSNPWLDSTGNYIVLGYCMPQYFICTVMRQCLDVKGSAQ